MKFLDVWKSTTWFQIRAFQGKWSAWTDQRDFVVDICGISACGAAS